VKNIYNDAIFPKRHDALHLATDEKLWEACPYMQGIPISQIGDKVEDEEVKEETQDEYLARVIQEEEEEYLRKLEQEEEEARCQERLRYDEEHEDEYEAYRDNDDYYDQWDEPYSCEYPITRRELAQLPVDMRAVFDPEYQEGLANFRAAAMQK
jgi:hypothetical protein